jgi:hypothetical protein
MVICVVWSSLVYSSVYRTYRHKQGNATKRKRKQAYCFLLDHAWRGKLKYRARSLAVHTHIPFLHKSPIKILSVP